MTGSGQPQHSIAVVMPAYNEAANIREAMGAVPAWVDAIYVVDDASSDDTSDVATAVGDPRARVLRHSANRGVGGAMVTGYRAALADGHTIVVKMDSDGQMPAAEMDRLIRPILTGIADYTKGNRFKLPRSTTGMPPSRKFGSVLLSFLTKMASGYWHIFDSQCGFTAIRASFLALIDLDRIASDYFFENDMLIKLNAMGARVVDVPTSTLYGNETSTVSIPKIIATFPPRLVSRWLARLTGKYLVIDFGAVGILASGAVMCLLFGGVFGGYHWFLSATTNHVASTGTVMIAVLPIIIGIQMLLQAFVMEVLSSPGSVETRAYIQELVVSGELS